MARCGGIITVMATLLPQVTGDASYNTTEPSGSSSFVSLVPDASTPDPDDLKPVMADLMTQGRPSSTPRPYLGLNSEEVRGRVFVTKVAPDTPWSGSVLGRLIMTLEEEMKEAAADLRFEYAARLRDEIGELKRELRDAG